MSAEPHQAWETIARYYGQPGARELLLRLQQRYRISVTTILTLAWNAAHGRGAPGAGAAARIAECTERYQASVLRPLRSARDGLRQWREALDPEAGELREALLSRELEAERLEQRLVLDCLDAPGGREPAGDPLGDLCLSLSRYLVSLGVEPDGEAVQAVEHLASLALEDYDGVHVGQIWARAWASTRGGDPAAESPAKG